MRAGLLLLFSTMLVPPAEARFACSDVFMLFARGSGQKVGRSNETKKFFEKVRAELSSRPDLSIATRELGTSAYEGNKYPAVGGNVNMLEAEASWTGFLGGEYRASVREGRDEAVAYLNDRAIECPEETWVLGGYSQGAHVIGDALFELSSSALDRIAFVAHFGDPKLKTNASGPGPFSPTCGWGVQHEWVRGSLSCDSNGGILEGRSPYRPGDLEGRVGSWCDDHDPICSGTEAFLVVGNKHSKYPEGWMAEAADEVAEHVLDRVPPPTTTTTTTRPRTTTTTRPRNSTTTTTRPPTTTTTTLPKNRAPQITGVSPADGGLAHTNTPVLSVSAKDPDKDPLRFFFRVEGEGVAVESGWIHEPRWQVPPYLLDPTETYRWWVRVEDPKGLQANSGLLTFRVAFMPVAAEMVATPDGQGYWTVDTEGLVRRFGSAKDYGSLKKGLVQNVIGMARTPDGGGYWLVGSDGGVFAFGNAGYYDSMGGKPLNAPIVAMAPTPDGGGYWLVAKDGGVFAFGNAPFLGSMGGTRLNAPVVGMAPTKHGRGYWLAAQDGGIFAFGDAVFYGSTGGVVLNYPVTDIAPHPTGEGYWLVAEDGGVFAFGAAPFLGSTAGQALNGRIVAMETTPDGGGYWLLGCDGGIFAFGNAPFLGSPEPKYACRGIPALPGKPVPPPVTTPPSSLPACMALKAVNGQYVTAAQGGGTSVSVTAVVSGPEASFKVVPVGDRFGLRTSNGVYFLVAEGGGGRADGNAMRANRWVAGLWEQLAAERIGANHLALRTATGHYVTAELGGGAHLATNRTTAGAWERFEIVPQPDSFCSEPPPPTSLWGGAVMSRHTQLVVGGYITSPSGNAIIWHQGDGNVVLYGAQGGNWIPLWATSTNGATSSFVLQPDGNLVVYGPSGSRWASGTAGFPETWAQLQDDCNFVLYGPGATPLWASNTQCPGPPPPPPTPISWCGHAANGAFGPLRYCYRGTTASADAGFYSPLTGGFSPAVGPWPTRDAAVHEFWSATIDSPDVFYFVGGPSVDTGYGPVSYGEQRWPNSGFGPVLRWGAFNFLTGKFYPSHGWMQDLG